MTRSITTGFLTKNLVCNNLFNAEEESWTLIFLNLFLALPIPSPLIIQTEVKQEVYCETNMSGKVKLESITEWPGVFAGLSSMDSTLIQAATFHAAKGGLLKDRGRSHPPMIEMR